MILLSGCAYITLDEHLDRLEEFGEEWVDSGSGAALDDDSGRRSDTADTGGHGSDPVYAIEDVDYEYTDGNVYWWIRTGAVPKDVQLALIETGADGFEYDCDDYPRDWTGELVCGAWSELHSSFPLESEDGTDQGQRLEVVSAVEEQDADQSTLFPESLVESTVTWLARVKFDAGASWDDCWADGHNPAWFSKWCD